MSPAPTSAPPAPTTARPDYPARAGAAAPAPFSSPPGPRVPFTRPPPAPPPGPPGITAARRNYHVLAGAAAPAPTSAPPAPPSAPHSTTPRAAPRAANPWRPLPLPPLPPLLPAHFTSPKAAKLSFSTTPRPKTPGISAVEAPTDSVVDPSIPASFCARRRGKKNCTQVTRTAHNLSIKTDLVFLDEAHFSRTPQDTLSLFSHSHFHRLS